MLMGTFMKVNGRMIKHMALEIINMLTELPITEIGRMISNMEKELRRGLTMQGMKETISKAKSMEEELFNLQMEVCILVTSNIMKYQEKGSINGLTERLMMGSGRRTRCMGMESYLGKMVKSMKDSL